MTQAVQLRKGTTAEHSTFTGLQAEATVDTTKKTLVVHDGSTAGGIPLSREDLSNSNPSNLTAIVGADTASGDLFVVYDVSASAFKKITRAELNNAMEQDALASVAITGGSINGTTIGASTASTGAFTTLSASSTISGNGFSAYLASPPTIGGTSPGLITGTTITATSQFSGPHNGSVGATSPSSGTFTALASLSVLQNAKTIASSSSISAGNNGISLGPVTISSGVVFTVPSSSIWKILEGV